MKRLNIVDGYGYIYRAFFALPSLTNSKGLPIGCVYGFCRMLLSLLKKRKDEPFVVVFDTGKESHRHKIYKDYKAKRKEAPDELKLQFPLVRDATRALGIPSIEKEGYEADDIIASLAKWGKKHHFKVSIISSDKDFMQLIEKDITMHDPLKDKEIRAEEVVEKFGVPPEKVVEVMALMGDASDNIPGVPGIGPKTAKDLIVNYSSLEELYQRMNELPPSKRKESLIDNKQSAFLSKELVTLNQDVDIDLNPSNISNTQDPKLLREFFKEYEFSSLLKLIPDAPSEDTAALDDFLKTGLKSLALEIYYQDHLSRCENINYRFNDIKEIKDLLQNSGIEKIVDSIKPLLKDCLEKNIEIQGFDGIDVMSTSVNLGRSDHTVSNLCNLYGVDETYPLSILNEKLKSDITKNHAHTLYQKIDKPLAMVLCKMEQNGIFVDPPYLEKLKIRTNEELSILHKKIIAIVGYEFNINSPKQLGKILFDQMQLPYDKKTKTGAYATDVDTLLALQRAGHEIAGLILQWRNLTKSLNTYIEVLLNKNVDGKIFTNFSQTQTLTGRLASSNPNIQNIPVKEIRTAFIASPSNTLLAFDYSQIELRLLAHFSHEETLTKGFNQGLDIHSVTAQELFGKDQVTPEHRKKAKIVNFGVLYGMSAHGLGEALQIDRTEAKAIIDHYFKRYPGIKAYIDNQIALARKEGYVQTIMGRKIYIKDIHSANRTLKQFAERQSINAPLQGSNADMIKLAMIEIQNYLEQNKCKTKMVLQIHDELIFDTPLNEADQIEQGVKAIMENVQKLSVPLVINSGRGKNWGEIA